MGDPRRIRRKYIGPSHPWQKSRLDEERALMRDYALKNKKELWRMSSILKKFTNQAKKLIASLTEQGEREKEQLISKLFRLGLLSSDAKVEDVLSLSVKDILERRLQTLVFRKAMAKTMKQARQFIVHEHIRVNNKKVTSPSSLVTQRDEATIEFCDRSKLANIDHPERTTTKEQKEESEKEPDKKTSGQKDKAKNNKKPKNNKNKGKEGKEEKKEKETKEEKKK
ncbi:30S ribosomal protein S4 [Candidatus Woesearchaeota archaeon]|nr:MAG: 30S ribosomal protein S4 [Candidatus Woesearchaeota archaeon]